jgi:hypothetical protein
MEYKAVTIAQSSVDLPLGALKSQAMPHYKNTKARHVPDIKQ